MGKGKRSDQYIVHRGAVVILGLATGFVATGCGVLKPGGDEIGDGFMTEGGWDPFADERAVASELDDTDRTALDRDPFPGEPELAPADPAIRPVASTPSSSDSKAIEDLFAKADYQKALAGARALRSKSAPGSADRDVADFVAGASLYYLGDFQEAQGLIDSHVENFPTSRHRESALYYQGSNRVRLRQWRVGAAHLDRFIATYPESLLLEFALFDRATCHHGLGESQECIQLVDQLQREYIYSKIRDRSLALKGDAQREAGDLAGAQLSYQRAREAARELKHPKLEARCLAHLISVSAERGQSETAVASYHSFFQQFADSQYSTEAALGGLPALQATGDLAAGLERLEQVMQEMPQKTDASVFHETLLAFSKYYRDLHDPEKLLRKLGDMSSAPEGSDRFKEQLIIARLEALETYFPENEAEIRVFYNEMRARFEPSDLSTANVIKLADHIAPKDPEEAISWYESALARGSSLHGARATLGLAKAQAAAGRSSEAQKGFKEVLETFGSPELAEEATIGIARIARTTEDWNLSAYYWENYLNHRDWDLAREEARNGLAEAKSHGGVARAPASPHIVPVKKAPGDPVTRELSKAETLAAAGKKEAAYSELEKLIQRHGSTPGLPQDAAKSLSLAKVMHEDLGIELGK